MLSVLDWEVLVCTHNTYVISFLKIAELPQETSNLKAAIEDNSDAVVLALPSAPSQGARREERPAC
jgi:hypothetical protein